MYIYSYVSCAMYVHMYMCIHLYVLTHIHTCICTCSLSHTHIREEQKRNIHAQYYNGTKNTHLHQHQTYNSMNTKYNTHMIPMK